MKRYRFVLIAPLAIGGILFLFFSLLVIGTACNSKKHAAKSENDIDAARNFIQAALNGKFDEARSYMLSDSVNSNYMDVAERSFEKADAETINGYRGASINMHQVTALNDSITVVIFSNSFKNDHDTLKVVKENGEWLVDLKYLYQHDQDSIPINKPNNDPAR